MLDLSALIRFRYALSISHIKRFFLLPIGTKNLAATLGFLAYLGRAFKASLLLVLALVTVQPALAQMSHNHSMALVDAFDPNANVITAMKPGDVAWLKIDSIGGNVSFNLFSNLPAPLRIAPADLGSSGATRCMMYFTNAIPDDNKLNVGASESNPSDACMHFVAVIWPADQSAMCTPSKTVTVNVSLDDVANPPVASVDITCSVPAPQFVVTPSADANGAISPATAQSVNAGETTVFTVTPAAGYVIDQVAGCNGTTDRRFNHMRPSIAPRKRHQAG